MLKTLISLAILLPWLGAATVLLAGNGRPRLQHTLAVFFSLGSGAAALALIPECNSGGVVNLLPVDGVFGQFTFTADGLGTFLAAVAAVIGSLAVIFSINYMEGEEQLGRYYAFVLFFIGAMVGLVLTTNLLLIFVFWEITALCSYALISFHNDDPRAVAGGIKALIMTQLGGIGLLAGTAIIYGSLGTYDINTFLLKAQNFPPQTLSILAFGFLIAAAAKSAQFPFQTWLPDAMEAPTPISALIHAATMVNAGVYLLARFYPAFAGVAGWREAVMAVGMISAVLAALMAAFAVDLKRVLAYSTVSQLGYMVYAVGTGAIFASQFHLLSHSVFKALLFLSAGSVIHAVGTRDMHQMGGLGKTMPLVRTVFIIGSLALAGIPVLNGFWSKELVLEAGLEHGPFWMYLLMLAGAGLTAFYTFRCVMLVFFGEPRNSLHGHEAGPAMKVALIPLAIGTLTTWLLAGPFGSLLATTLPQHHLEADSTSGLISKVINAPATLAALAVIAAGLAVWCWRASFTQAAKKLWGLRQAAAASFGFEAINHMVVDCTQSISEMLRRTQTGLLNWNIFAIITALVIVLILTGLRF